MQISEEKMDLILEFLEKNKTELIESRIVTLDTAGNVAETGEKKPFGIDLSQNEIYESCDYEYSFSTSLFGKITLEFNGKSYEVDLDDDGTISSIDFYGD